MPKDICYHCHLKRERDAAIKRNNFYKDAIFGTYTTNNDTKEVRDHSISHYLYELVKDSRNVTGDTGFIIFDNDELVELKNKLYNGLKTALANYKPSDLPEMKKHFGSFEQVHFEGREYELEIRFNENHRDLSNSLHHYKTFEQAASEGWTYYLHIVKGITNRDDAVLRFINFIGKGSTTTKALNDQYANILTEKEVLDTLKKLERFECLEIENDVIKITTVGQGVLF